MDNSVSRSVTVAATIEIKHWKAKENTEEETQACDSQSVHVAFSALHSDHGRQQPGGVTVLILRQE